MGFRIEKKDKNNPEITDAINEKYLKTKTHWKKIIIMQQSKVYTVMETTKHFF